MTKLKQKRINKKKRQKVKQKKIKERERTYLAATHQPAHLAAQRYAGLCQPAASSPPGRQRADDGERELATTPAACHFARLDVG